MIYAELRVDGGKHDGKVIALMEKFLVGREEDCHLRPNSDLVSRHHCVFTKDDFTVRLRDLGSTNGTFVNDEWVKGQIVLKDGDKIRIGKLDFVISIRQAGGQAPQQPPQQMPQVVGDSGMNVPPTQQTAQFPTAPPQGYPPAGGAPPPQQPPSMMDSQVYGGDTQIFRMPVPGQYPQQPQQPQQPYQPQPVQMAPDPYAQQQAYAPQEPQAVEAPQAAPAVRLPPPSETGAVAPAPAPESEAPAPTGDEEGNPSDHAADIIKKFNSRR